jgi:predicted polyphosphate/ATP-dependent NAD kinase
VAHGRVVPNQEKSNTLRRVLLGLDAVGVERALLMPDRYSLARQALDGLPLTLDAKLLDMWLKDAEDDSVRAATAMREAGAGCLVVLGGDGTNRAVAKACGDVPLLSISTGTNNVFPVMVEGTVAGLAAGLVARGLVPLESVCVPSKRLEVYLDGALHDLALVDVAVAAGRMVGAGAIWDIEAVSELFLTRAQVGAIGLSSIGAGAGAGGAGNGAPRGRA